MLTWEEHALLTNIGDRLIDLYAKRDDAMAEEDFDRVDRLQAEIRKAAAERRELLQSVAEAENG